MRFVDGFSWCALWTRGKGNPSFYIEFMGGSHTDFDLRWHVLELILSFNAVLVIGEFSCLR